MRAPISGQIPRTIEAEAASSHTPDGQPARNGIGSPNDFAYPIIPSPFVRCPQPDLTKKVVNNSRPARTIAPTPAPIDQPPMPPRHPTDVRRIRAPRPEA